MTNASPHARQVELETTAIKRGVERYFKARDRDKGRGREYDNVAVNGMVVRAMRKLAPAIRKTQTECEAKLKAAQTKGSRLGGWEENFLALPPETLAYITMKSAVSAGGERHTVQRLCGTIGRMCSLEVQWAATRRAENKSAKEREQDPPNRISVMKMRVKQINPKSVAKWLKRLDDLEVRPWPARTQFTLGAALLKTLLEACPEVVEKEVITRSMSGRIRTSVQLNLTSEFIARMREAHEERALSEPWLTPMVCPPRPWVAAGDAIRGGYLELEHGMVKEAQFRHTTLDGVSDEVLAAVNLVQNTKWRINTGVLAEAQHHVGMQSGPIPYEADMEMPENLSSEEWDNASREERGKVKSKREAVHSHNNRMVAKRTAASRVLATAEMFKDEPVIYFPHSIDWRGRMYPLPQDLNPQGDDFTKALLEFAEGKALGARGLKWLKYHTANCFGMDKVTRDEQEAWVDEHTYLICRVANGTGIDFWQRAEEPWQFLAACRELQAAYKSDDPESYVSHLPVSIDGSCNGLQHLSAMGLDPVGAEAVNLTPGPRRDIYTIVADDVQSQVDGYVLLGSEVGGKRVPEAQAWLDHVNRKVVKRGVMTTPYGLTPMGMRTQLLNGGFCNDLEGDRLKNANFMRDCMKRAIGDTIVVGTQIMQWFQDCAEILVDEHQPIEWTTPMGLRVRQAYIQQPATVVRSLMGHIRFADPDSRDEEGVVKRTKQIQSIAPNIIHSFDAAHLMMTVLMTGEADMSYAMVHDSYGCHAADMDFLSQCTRESFVKIYKEDWFEEMFADFSTQRGLPVVPPPERGTFDVEQVLESEYFFA